MAASADQARSDRGAVGGLEALEHGEAEQGERHAVGGTPDAVHGVPEQRDHPRDRQADLDRALAAIRGRTTIESTSWTTSTTTRSTAAANRDRKPRVSRSIGMEPTVSPT